MVMMIDMIMMIMIITILFWGAQGYGLELQLKINPRFSDIVIGENKVEEAKVLGY